MRQFIKKKKSKRTIIEDILEVQFKEAGILFYQKEYRFYPKRRWRVDFAFIDQKLLIEVQGGTYMMGRHTQGKGYANDREKANTAQEEGWMILEYDTNHVKKGHAIDQICRILSRITGSQFNPPNIGGNNESSTSGSRSLVRKPKKRKKRLTNSEPKLARKSRSAYLRGLCRNCSRKKTECVCTAACESV